MSAVIDLPRRHRVTVAEFLRMGAARVFGADARLELIDGEIVEMAPIGPPHAGTLNALNGAFATRAERRYIVAVQNPVALGERSLPQPDLALLRYREDAYSTSHPTPKDVLLLVEVADTTLEFDLGEKARLYARAGIYELWVADLERRAVHVCREPGEQGYGSVTRLTAPVLLRPLRLPDLELPAALLFPEQGETAGDGR
jgi:Uma2 family endonuclease